MKTTLFRTCSLIAVLEIIASFGGGAVAGEKEDSRRKLALYFQGIEVFETNCQMCHGPNGKGDGEWAADWTKNRPRNFRTGTFKFRTTPMGFLPTDDDLKRTILEGISGTAMPTFKKHLRDQELEAVIAYLKSFSREWKKKEKHAEPVELPEKPEWMTSREWTKPHAEAGKKIFAMHCMACHGSEGKGDGPGALALKDVWGFDIKPVDLSGEHFKSGDKPEDWFRTIALGLDGTPMIGFRGALTDEGIWDLIAFIQTLKGKK